MSQNKSDIKLCNPSFKGTNCLECGKHIEQVIKQGGCDASMVEGMSTPEKAQYKSSLDVQVGGGHYKDMKIQPIEFITANDIPYREANVIKYTCRHKNKNGVEDIKKAIHYLEMILEDYKDEH